MGGKGKRRSDGDSGKSKARSSRSNRNLSASAASSSGRRRRSSLFVEGGVLSDFRLDSSPVTPSPGGSSRRKGLKPGSSDRANVSASRTGPRKCNGNTFGYQYPSMTVQEGLEGEPGIAGNYGNDKMDESDPMALVESKETKIVAYLDQTPSSSKAVDVNYDYEYSPSFVLGDDSHKGLGFCDKSDATPIGTVSISKPLGDQEGSTFDSFSTEGVDAEEESDDEVDASEDEEVPNVVKSLRKNPGFISIGGMKLYTEDISDEESNGEEVVVDDDDDEESEDEEGAESSEQEGLSESSVSDSSEDMFDSDPDIDEEVAEDYLEGIGGRKNVLEAHWLAEQSLDLSDDDSSSSDSFHETTKKLGAIALQEASKEYGMKKSTRSRSSRDARDTRELALDDLMLAKDPRGLSGKKKKKKHAAKFPRSWPLEAQKSKNSRRFPGEKKKHRKEMIAVKRRERMLRRGVDLAEINSKLEQIVLEGMDMHCFQRMHHRDCSQVRRLAAIYRLSSSCQGSGKKSFVAVTRRHQTCMPSASDKLRIEKLIGAGDEDSDFAVNEVANVKSASADQKKAKNSAKKHSLGEARERNRSKRKGSYANQPLSFVSSGVIHSETASTKESLNKDTKQVAETSGNSGAAQFGAFEVHTKGFGSKMMAKMGFVEGGGLGKDGKGMAQPIEVVQRPKSLGLGLDFSINTEDPSSSSGNSKRNNRASSEKHVKGFSYDACNFKARSGNKKFGAFEQHTKGFGSKMMAKMGFVEGTGLGRDSQGIVNPLVAVRRPKARGLGAEG